LEAQCPRKAMLVASDDMLPVFTGLIEAAKKAADK